MALSTALTVSVPFAHGNRPFESDAEAALRIGTRNIESFKTQTSLMIAAWQQACKIDKACTTADQSILAKVYSYYAEPLRCRGNTAFLEVAPETVATMVTEGYTVSRAGYNLSSALAKECFAHDTTVMAAGDLEYGIQDVEEEFAIVPGTGGSVIYVSASFSMGWKGKPLRNVKSIYRYEFDDAGKITDWDARYDPIFVYDFLGGRTGRAACAIIEAPARTSGDVAGAFAGGTLVGIVACIAALRLQRASTRAAAAARPSAGLL